MKEVEVTAQSSSKRADYNPRSRLLRYLPLAARGQVRRMLRGPALLRDYASDFTRFLRHSSTAGFTTEDQVLSRITATYHNIEKGLSLPEPRLGFGAPNLRLLLDLIQLPGIDSQAIPVRTARHVLAAYVALHDDAGRDDFPYREEILRVIADTDRVRGSAKGGLRSLTREDILAATQTVSDEFFLQRHSIRQYSGEPVDVALIVDSIRLAQKSPAVCNRQAAYVYIVADAAKKRELIDFQGGARGFGEGLDKLLIVTTRLSNFWAPGERSQPWVDGGLFAMSLIYALHARGLGTVCLNWSRSTHDSARLRELVGMNDDQVTIMMIGVGQLRDNFTVPVSVRADVASSYRLI